MTLPSADFLTVLAERGFIHQCTDLDGLAQRLARGPIRAYIGFDATADSLHVGHLVSIMALRWLQRTGNRPIVLVGGATTRIGDPSFRDTSRPVLGDAGINANIDGISRAFARYLDFGHDGATLVNNTEWLDGLGYVPFLRDIGIHFTVNRMLFFDSVRLRLEREQPLTFLEFNYMLLQAFHFLDDLLVEGGLAASRGEARRLVRGGGVRVNGDVLTDEGAELSPAQLGPDGLRLSAGRKRHMVVRR